MTSTKNKLRAGFLIISIIIAPIYYLGLYIHYGFFLTEFTIKKECYDVNEEVKFQWKTLGGFREGIVLFGDGEFTHFKYPEYSLSHNYTGQGKYQAMIKIWTHKKRVWSDKVTVKIQNDPPNFRISVPSEIYEGDQVNISVKNVKDSKIDLKNDEYKYIYSFADGKENTTFNRTMTHSWKHSGKYPLTVTVIDDQGAISQKKKTVHVKNVKPMAKYSHKAILTSKGYYFRFDASLSNDTLNDMASLEYNWDFGDGTYGYGKIVKHSFVKKGKYNVTLSVADDNGQGDIFNKTLNIREDKVSKFIPPYQAKTDLEILGPLSFSHNYEGHTYVLDVDVSHPFYAKKGLKYRWLDENWNTVSENRKPVISDDDGHRPYRFKVTDYMGNSVTKKININFHNRAPEVFISDYSFHGPIFKPHPILNLFDKKNPYELEIYAYGFDSFYDINNLKFSWKITYGNKTWRYDSPENSYGILKFVCEKSGIYHGTVKVEDPSGKTGLSTFRIHSVIDDDANGYSNLIEGIYEQTSESIYNFTDKDKDFLTDSYEMIYSSTNSLNPDSDGDGLFDGFDSSGIGELTLSTSPSNPDCDSDNLTDGIEYYGWNITINGFQGLKNRFHVSSDPLLSDTDKDGLSDYIEYLVGTNPRDSDSDMDGLNDKMDPSPISYDSDGDYLSDGEEYRRGTNLNNSDTDSDDLKDGEEIYGWGFKGFRTDPLDPDCDDDFLPDPAEMKIYRINLEDQYANRIRKKIEGEISLYFPYMFSTAASANIRIAISFGEYGVRENKEYGVSENEVTDLLVKIVHEENGLILFKQRTGRNRYFAQTIDITKYMNNLSLNYNYHGNYKLILQGDTSNCILEKFELEFGRYLDPYDSDFDNDGIYDGVEMNPLVYGEEIHNIEDRYNETQRIIAFNSNYNSSSRQFLIKVPEIGKKDDGNLFFKIQSENILTQDLKVKITLQKSDLQHVYKELYLITQDLNYSLGQALIYSSELNLNEIISKEKMRNIGGLYKLNIQLLRDNVIYNTTDTIRLEKFSVSVKTYTEAGEKDGKAWITDPTLDDTDNDGLNDYREIYEMGTSPLSQDTDGDGAFDNLDRDPLKNLVLKVSIISGAFRNQYFPYGSPYLQILIKTKINDLKDPNGNQQENNIGIPTTVKLATTDPTWWGANQIAWWNSGSGTHYYIDINDDTTFQSNNINFSFQLWQVIENSGDVNIFKGWLSKIYSINSVGHSEILTVTHTGCFQGEDEVKVKVSTLGIERANTIAIYDPDKTLFNGHYQTLERMNVFQLYVTNNDESTPFVKGANTIVIPTSLFEKTKLNSYIEKKRIGETPLYSTNSELFQFYSIDREGNLVNATDDVDFIFVRFELTASEAMEILNMLLTIVKNVSQEDRANPETVLAYKYVSTKKDGINPVLMNIPKGSMMYIPWEFSYEQSDFGEMPEVGESVNLLFLWLYLVSLPFLVVITFFQFVMEDIQTENDKISAENGLGTFPAIGSILWVFVRSALIIFSYMCLALEVLTTSAIFSTLGGLLGGISNLSGFDCQWDVNLIVPYGVNTKSSSIDLSINQSTITLAIWINWTYWAYFDMYFPIPRIDFNIDAPTSEPSETPQKPSLHCGFERVGENDTLKYDFFTTYKDQNGDPPKYVKLKLRSPNGNEILYDMTPTEENYDFDLLHIKGIKYNKTLDFSDKNPGQWFYSFLTQDDSNEGFQAKWPVKYAYEPGPFISEDLSPEPIKYFLYSDYEYDVLYTDQELTFSVTGADFINNLIPEDVRLNVLLPDGRIVSSSMKMSSEHVIEDEENSENDVTLRKYTNNINISKFTDIQDPFTVRFFYSAEFEDNRKAFLFDITEQRRDDTEEFYSQKTWFEGPTLISKKGNREPKIIGWKIEEVLSGSIFQSNSISTTLIGPITEEQVLRFWVYVADPNGTHEEHYERGFEIVPYTILERYDLSKNETNKLNVTLPMVWAGKYWDPYPNMDAYFIDLRPNGLYTFDHTNMTTCGFRPGVWKFKFAVKDPDSEQWTYEGAKANNDPIKIWSIGSANEMWNVAFNGFYVDRDLIKQFLPGMGIFHSIGLAISYGAAAITSMCPNTKGVGHILALGIAKYDIISSFAGLFNLFLSGRTGAILGLGVNSVFTLAGLKLAFLLGTIRSKLMSLENIGSYLSHLKIVSEIGSFLFLFNLVLMLTLDPVRILDLIAPNSFGIPEEIEALDPEYPGEEMIQGASSEIISLLFSMFGLGAILNLAAVKEVPFTEELTKDFLDKNIADPIIKTLRYHILIKGVVSILSFLVFFYETGMPYLIGDFYNLLQS